MSEYFLFLQVFWFFAVGAVLILYATTAGFDYGTTLMLPFMKKEDDRRVMLNVVGLTWDGNQTWLVFAGGALFVIYPTAYASVFSGLYAAMFCILWSLFLRPPGFDYRSKIDSDVWRRMWDWALFLSACIPVFVFGMLLGDFLHGIPMYFDPIMLRPFNSGDFWGLLNLPGCFCGIVAILMVLMHGASLQHRRTEGKLKEKFSRLFLMFSALFLIFFTVTGLIVAFVVKGYVLVHSPYNATNHVLDSVVKMRRGAWIQSYGQYPWKVAPPIIAYVSVFLAALTLRVGRGTFSFWCSCLAVAGTLGTLGATLFPFVVPSISNPNQSITVWNGTSTFERLEIMFYITLVCFTLMFIYKLFVYWGVWHKKATVDIDDIKQNEHMSY